MARVASRPGFTAGFVAVVILVELAAVRLALSADTSGVYLFGKEINAVCLFKQRLGVPCPTCGITRSVVLTLHGQAGPAWQLNPGGPIAVLTALYLSGALLTLAFRQWKGGESLAATALRRIRFSTVTLALALTVAIAVHWTSELVAAAGRWSVR